MATRDPRKAALSALMVAQQREEDGIAPGPMPVEDMPSNWVPPPRERGVIGDMPANNPATAVALMRRDTNSAALGTDYLWDGLDTHRSPRSAGTADMRAQVVERSGAGAPGMVYAEDDSGGVTLTTLERATRQGWRVVDGDEAKEIGAADLQRSEENAAMRTNLAEAGRRDGARAVAMLDAGKGRPFKGLSAADAADLDAQQERFQQGLRLKGAAPPNPSGTGSGRRPQVAVSQVGPSGPVPQARPLSAPRSAASVAEGTPAQLGRGSSPATAGDAEFAAAQDAAEDRRRSVSVARAGAQINKALSGADYDAAAYNEMEQGADSPVRRLLEQREADKRKALEDPTSDASRRVQAAVAKAMPGVYSPDELSRITAGDADMVTKYGAMRQRLEERTSDMAREDALRAAKEAREDTIRADERRFQAQQAGAGRSFQAQQADKAFQRQKELAGLNNAADLEQAAVRARLGPDGQPVGKGAAIPGLEVEPGAAPTQDDAKKVKASRVAAEKMRGYVAELRELHGKYGTEYGGAAGTRMEQLGKAIQLEAKTIAELGALSGSDLDLMQSISGADPASLGANVKALVGIDNTATALQGLEKWVGTQEGATQRVYGYRPAGGQPQASASAGERKQYSPSRNVTRVLDAQGNVVRTEQGDTRGG
jgi:hypothetical protein